MSTDTVIVIEAWTKQPDGTITGEILNKDEFFAQYADKHGFWVAIRDLKVDRSEWDRLTKLMRSR